MDGSWDNTGAPPKRKGLSTGAKVALGCGLAFLLVAGGCAACVGYGLRKGATLMDTAWADMRKELEALRTDEGARALYASHPGLARRYPTVEAFAAAAAGWRGKLDAIPAQRPSFREMFDTKRPMSFSMDEKPGRKHLELRYPLPQGGVFHYETENGKLVDIGVE